MLLTQTFRSRGNNSPFLRGDDEQIVEEEEVDGVELRPHVEEGGPFGHLLQLPLLLEVPGLGDDRDGLEGNAQLAKRPVSQNASRNAQTFLGRTLSLSNSSDWLMRINSSICLIFPTCVLHSSIIWKQNGRGQIPGGDGLAG